MAKITKQRPLLPQPQTMDAIFDRLGVGWVLHRCAVHIEHACALRKRRSNPTWRVLAELLRACERHVVLLEIKEGEQPKNDS